MTAPKALAAKLLKVYRFIAVAWLTITLFALILTPVGIAHLVN